MWFGVMVTAVLQTYDSGNEKLTGWMEPHAMGIVATMIVLLMIVISLCLWVFLLRRNMRYRSSVVAKQHQLLQQREQQHRRLLETMPGALVLIQDEWIVYANPAALNIFGISDQEAKEPQRFMAFIPELCEGFIREQLDQIASGRKLSGIEGKLLRQDGSSFDASAFAAISDYQGKPAIQLILFDITERKQAEESMQAMQRQVEHTQRLESLGVLAGGIAHDFNNILAAIMGNAAMAERKMMADPESGRAYLIKVVQSAEKAALLCKQMLAYSGKGQFVVRPLDLSAMVKHITTLLEVSINRGVTINYDLTEPMTLIDADESQIQQVIMNLVINASDAIYDNSSDGSGDGSGEISISTGLIQLDEADAGHATQGNNGGRLSAGRYAYLNVSDTGCGMSTETREKIFEPFFTTKFTGRGLGMSAVLGIVQGHHGDIRICSKEGEGTTFKLLFPCSDVTEITNPQASFDTTAWQASGAILIVDDEENIRETAAAMLEDMGFDTLTARDGWDGVEVYRRHQQEVVAVLLDMTMPKLDGKGCCHELYRINEHVKVILSSGYNETEAVSRFDGEQLAGFIQKPYLPEVLEETMRSVTEKQ